MKKLEVSQKNIPQENAILVDWLTVTFHDVSPLDIMRYLGMDSPDIVWEDRLVFQDGYPRQYSFANITIRFGADDAANYVSDQKKSAADKVRTDMGVSLNMSGNGCRSFETYGSGNWLEFFSTICNLDTRVVFTRLDLAFDDFTGILDMNQIRSDVEDRNYTGSPKMASFVWKDDQKLDLQGLTIYIGSRKSPIFVRIYDKAAERGFTDRHWIRVEICMRADRAVAAVAEILNGMDVGRCFSGVLRNYCCFREPTNDSNKSRWPVADYWEQLLNGVDRIRLWISPGEPYNFRKTEEHMIRQYGQALIAAARIRGSVWDLLRECEKVHPNLKSKYKDAISEAQAAADLHRERVRQMRMELLGFPDTPWSEVWDQTDMAEIFGDALLP